MRSFHDIISTRLNKKNFGDKKMKKSILIPAILFLSLYVYAQSDFNLNKIAEFQNDKKLISIRPSDKVAPQDDGTGNRVLFNENGDLFIYNWDKLTTFKLTEKQSFVKVDSNFDFSDLPCLHGLHRVSKDYLYYTWTITSYMAINQKTGEKKFQVSLNDIFWNDFVYYDVDTDILFFHDKNNCIHSIVHPSLNDEENRKNYKNPDETLKLFFNETIINNTSLRVTKSGSLFINGNYTYWGQQKIGNYVYQINSGDCLVYEAKNPRTNFHVDCFSLDEQIESVDIHPSGDIYILRMNWQTNTHNLYYIENTWDPQWREQWYKEHPSAVRP